jgi:hypothetical protein
VRLTSLSNIENVVTDMKPPLTCVKMQDGARSMLGSMAVAVCWHQTRKVL